MGRKDFVPLSPKQRTLGTLDLLLIWFGAAIAITEIWAGGLPQLTALGLGGGLLAIVLGRLIGNGLMAAMARAGSETALPTMVLTRPTFGVRGSWLPALLNVLQLIGWTGWMLYVGFLYLDILASAVHLPTSQEQPAMRLVWVLLLGALCTLWAYGGQRFWRLAERIGGVLLLMLTVAMTAIVLQRYSIEALWGGHRTETASLLAGADLVVAMSVSWLPLVADYSRFARKPRSGARGTFWGYFIGGVWMYAVGLLVATALLESSGASGTTSPDQMVMQIMGSAGMAWALAAIVLVLLSTVTTAFLDIYSTVISAQNLLPRLPEKAGTLVAGGAGVLVALFLDVAAYEPFLLAIGAVFLPAFTIVLIDYYFVYRKHVQPSQLTLPHGTYWYSGGVNLAAIVAWACGFTVYDWAQGFSSIGYFAQLAGRPISAEALSSGASLPCIAASALVYLMLNAVLSPRKRKSSKS